MAGDLRKSRFNKASKKPPVPASQGVALGDLLGKKLEQVKRNREEEIKQMVRDARNNPDVQKSSKKFATAKPAAKPAIKPTIKKNSVKQ
ncbi:hypothetical protein AGMMS49938_04100 [Fibrobacterales bacterium]|nr:hypothetical protein AGMMS49938_04100 [Fibrobacterales bacterium]